MGQILNHNDFRDDLKAFLEKERIAYHDQRLASFDIMRFLNDEDYTLPPEQYKQLCMIIGSDYQDYLVMLPSSRKSAKVVITLQTDQINKEELDKVIAEARRLFSIIASSIDVEVNYSSKKN